MLLHLLLLAAAAAAAAAGDSFSVSDQRKYILPEIRKCSSTNGIFVCPVVTQYVLASAKECKTETVYDASMHLSVPAGELKKADGSWDMAVIVERLIADGTCLEDKVGRGTGKEEAASCDALLNSPRHNWNMIGCGIAECGENANLLCGMPGRVKDSYWTQETCPSHDDEYCGTFYTDCGSYSTYCPYRCGVCLTPDDCELTGCENGGKFLGKECKCECDDMSAGPSCARKACPAKDPFNYCEFLSEFQCAQDWLQKRCPWKCGLCEGMTCDEQGVCLGPVPVPTVPTAPAPTLAPVVGCEDFATCTNRVSAADKKLILDTHNGLRAKASKDATYMMKMYWNDDIAKFSQYWADKCSRQHSSRGQKFQIGLGAYIGENLAMGHASYVEAINDWHSEIKDFIFGVGSSSDQADVGHYTQVVQDKASHVGCAFNSCPKKGGRYWVCNYYSGQFDFTNPYTQGAQCSACGSCDSQQLCDCEGKICANGGQLNTNTCTCTCEGLWGGETCSVKDCTGKEDQYMCADWPQSDCEDYSNVPDLCPIKCGMCP